MTGGPICGETDVETAAVAAAKAGERVTTGEGAAARSRMPLKCRTELNNSSVSPNRSGETIKTWRHAQYHQTAEKSTHKHAVVSYTLHAISDHTLSRYSKHTTYRFPIHLTEICQETSGHFLGINFKCARCDNITRGHEHSPHMVLESVVTHSIHHAQYTERWRHIFA
jgi:hypothetical protein